jgi:hypothetical protein
MVTSLLLEPALNLQGTHSSQRRAFLILRLLLSCGLGLGMASIFVFFSVLLQWATWTLLFLELAVAISLTIVWRRHNRNITQAIEYSMDGSSSLPTSAPYIRWLPWLFVLSSVVAAKIFTIYLFSAPHGGWDGWAIWNLHARFLYRGGAEWNSYLTPLLNWTHPDYPLFLPLSVARWWKTLGVETTVAPMVLASFFLVATVALLSSSVMFLRSRDQGLLSGLLLLGTPFLLVYNSSQTADVPIGFYILCSLVCLALHDRQRQDSVASALLRGTEDTFSRKGNGILILAGLLAGMAAWTKNEGLLFVLAVAVARLWVERSRGIRSCLAEAAWFLGGALPFLALSYAFKNGFAPPTDLVSAQGANTLTRLTDASRWLTVAKSYVLVSQSFGLWLYPPIFGLAYYACLLRVRKGVVWSRVSTPIVAFALMLVGYFFVYLTTPYPLQWHINHSLDRLLLQLWPAFCFGISRLSTRLRKQLFLTRKPQLRRWRWLKLKFLHSYRKFKLAATHKFRCTTAHKALKARRTRSVSDGWKLRKNITVSFHPSLTLRVRWERESQMIIGTITFRCVTAIQATAVVYSYLQQFAHHLKRCPRAG